MSAATRTWVIQAERWGDAFTPGCQCGCGEPVKFTQGGVAKYANRAHATWDSGRLVKIRHGHIHGPVVDAADFRRAVRKIKAQKGWTWREVGERSGWGLGRLNGVMYGDAEWVLAATAREFFRRLAGMPGQMTAWERRKVEAEVAAGRRANIEITRYMTGRR